MLHRIELNPGKSSLATVRLCSLALKESGLICLANSSVAEFLLRKIRSSDEEISQAASLAVMKIAEESRQELFLYILLRVFTSLLQFVGRHLSLRQG